MQLMLRTGAVVGPKPSAARVSGRNRRTSGLSSPPDLRHADSAMNRAIFLQRIVERHDPWDFAIIGGGATGMGIAVDAAARGFQVVLLEQSDFGKGTSSRSTKLVHGGVRYLQQGNLSLVIEALR